MGLGVGLKPDSQEICFIPDNDYRRFLREYRPEAHKPGPIVDKTGKRLGTHDGIAFYTVGQRKGLRISSSERLYVIAIDEENNALVVGPEDDVFGTSLAVRDVNWSAPAPSTGPARPGENPLQCGAGDAVIYPGENGEIITRLIEPQRAITPGQAVVWYDGDFVVGGGIIDRQLPDSAAGGNIRQPAGHTIVAGTR